MIVLGSPNTGPSFKVSTGIVRLDCPVTDGISNHRHSIEAFCTETRDHRREYRRFCCQATWHTYLAYDAPRRYDR